MQDADRREHSERLVGRCIQAGRDGEPYLVRRAAGGLARGAVSETKTEVDRAIEMAALQAGPIRRRGAGNRRVRQSDDAHSAFYEVISRACRLVRRVEFRYAPKRGS